MPRRTPPRQSRSAQPPPPPVSPPVQQQYDGDEANFFGLHTRDAGMKRVFRIVEKAAQSESSVLLRGETGTGKELLAQALHALSPRSQGPFHAINCAALPANLLESELFGHMRGSFTGAVRDSPGHFRLANQGTLFLDEVAEIPLEVQAKLLRVLEMHSVIPVGGRESVRIDVRIIAATHRSLRIESAAGRFRADLMYRLRVVPIYIPPLRERGDDVLLLTGRFMHELNHKSRRPGNRQILRISEGARQILRQHDWPGNVRELRNVLEYAFVVAEGSVLEIGDLPPELSGLQPREPPDSPPPPAPTVSQPGGSSLDADSIRRALASAAFHHGHAAQLLGLSRVTLWRRMKQLGMVAPRGGRQS